MKAHRLRSRKEPWWSAAISYNGEGRYFAFNDYKKFNKIIQPALMRGELEEEVIELIISWSELDKYKFSRLLSKKPKENHTKINIYKSPFVTSSIIIYPLDNF